MFDMIRNYKDVYLAHITANLDEIISCGYVYPSAGCLVGSVYCVPAFYNEKTNELRLHNLGSYYYTKEIPAALRHPPKVQANPEILIIKASRTTKNGYAVEGVNYLRMGAIHFKAFDIEEDGNLLENTEREYIKRKIIGAISSEESFLVKTIEQHNRKVRSIEADLDYLKDASRTVDKISYFGYVLFEAFSTTLMLLQNDDYSIYCREKGEFNNWNYKEVMYEIYPEFSNNFRLSGFSPDWELLIKLCEKRGVFKGSSVDHFINSIAIRARKYICDNSFDDYRSFMQYKKLLHGSAINWDWAALNLSPLIGHMAHREFRNSDNERKEDLFRFFEVEKAKKIWAYWNKKDILFPFNAVVAKGEMGVNPCFSDVELKFYKGNALKLDNLDVIVTIGERLQIKMRRELGELRHTLRRSLDEKTNRL
ncbi:MAG: hypothetical protein ACKN9T_16635 [Candidatus Methylumidiphilus sp.]